MTLVQWLWSEIHGWTGVSLFAAGLVLGWAVRHLVKMWKNDW